MVGKKAQLSFETIIIYGLIIVVVTLAVGALVYFGVLDLGAMLPEKCVTGSAEIPCENYQMEATAAGSATIQVEIRNRMGKRADFIQADTSIRGTEDWEGISCTSSVPAGTVNPDNTKVITFTCNDPAVGTGAIGQRFKGDMTIGYRSSDSTLAKRATGPIFMTITG